MNNLKSELNEAFDLMDMGAPSKIVGIKISQMTDSITLSQKQYLLSVLQNEEMENVNPVSTLLDPNTKLKPNTYRVDHNVYNSYATLLSQLQYLVMATKLDITFAVNRLVMYMSNPNLSHYSALKQVLRYLTGTKDYGITYRKGSLTMGATNLFYGYADAAYQN
jgi:hypothetical protein